jgi:lysine biosynthesis protein LysW
MARVRSVKCPECGDEFELEDYLEMGDTALCPSCDTELKIKRIDPPQVEVIDSASDQGDEYGEGGMQDSEEF